MCEVFSVHLERIYVLRYIFQHIENYESAVPLEDIKSAGPTGFCK